MVVNSQEIKEIVSSTLNSLAEGLENKDSMIAGFVEFELSIIKEGNMKGGFKLILAEASGKYDEKRISKIKFSVIGKGARKFEPFMWKPKFS